MEIPEGWEVLLGKQVSDLITKGSSPKWQGFNYQDDGVMFITSENVCDGRLNVSKPKYLPPAFSLKEKKSVLKKGDILINIVGASIGRSCQYNLDDTDANINQAVCLFRPTAKVCAPYLAYILQSKDGVRRLIGRQSDGARPNLSLADIKAFKFLLPPLPEQRRIAEILRTWDRAIVAIEALIAKSEAQKKALMQQLLTGKRRLPGFEGKWKEVPLKEVFERVKTKNKGASDNALTISAQMGLVSQEEFFNKRVAADNLSNYILLENGDFAYNKSYSNGYPMGAIKPLELYEHGVVSTLYICFRLKSSNDDHAYYRNYFEAGCFNQEIAAFAQEGARNHGLLNIAIGDFFNGRIARPPSNEQKAIAEVLEAAESHLSAHKAKLQTLKTEKAALMQQLLTGKRRLKLTEAA